MSWTHPICSACWHKTHGNREPVRVKEPTPEHCGWCGGFTLSGIYVRADPRDVPHAKGGDDGHAEEHDL